MKGIIIYHKKDLDGLTSGAILSASFKNYELIGYHYGEALDIRKFRAKRVIMVDVSLEPERMFSLANISSELIFIDHHKSAYDKILEYADENDKKYSVGEFNGLIKDVGFTEYNFRYFYSERLSACEMSNLIYPIGIPLANEKIKLLGQYDTWRNNEEKKFATDKDWKIVMCFQYGMRRFNTVKEVKTQLYSKEPIEFVSTIGNAILKYQEGLSERAIEDNAFELDFCGLRVIACNGVPFNSNSFKTAYHEDIHDAMMPFQFDGKNNRWNFSLYTTKKDVDILSIAKNFGGGGHQQACGFSISADEIIINSKEIKLCQEK